ncbi:helix-turn-helix domain-containing protein [Spirillospora sp. CA-128828]|uniref:helix-turn-helix domain-containing protein n=1 Tax=Spirillospora sp. CA-128828 TaxID=3240033 RepID=UPI003D8B2EA3
MACADESVSSIARLLQVSRSTLYKYVPEAKGGALAVTADQVRPGPIRSRTMMSSATPSATPSATTRTPTPGPGGQRGCQRGRRAPGGPAARSPRCALTRTG